MVELIYENKSVLHFFQDALAEIEVPYRVNFIEETELDISQPPDDIVYLNCVGADSHIRGNRSALIRLEQYLEHLAAYNRNVINDYRTLDYLMSHVAQIRLMKRFGLTYPQTVFSSNVDELLSMANNVNFPAVVRYDRSAQSSSAQICSDWRALDAYLRLDSAASTSESVILVQQYIEPRDGVTSRVEIIDYEPVYTVNFRCDLRLPSAAAEYSSVETQSNQVQPVSRYVELCQASGLRMAGIQYVTASNGSVYTLGLHGAGEYSIAAENQTGHQLKRAALRMIQKMLN